MCSAVAWRRVAAAVKLWLGMLKKNAVASAEVREIRLITCQNCPVFVRWAGTCGSPLSQGAAKEFEPGPCWCFMEAKTWAAEATCFLDDTLGDGAAPYGWKHALRSAKSGSMDEARPSGGG